MNIDSMFIETAEDGSQANANANENCGKLCGYAATKRNGHIILLATMKTPRTISRGKKKGHGLGPSRRHL
jgi:hypothetical protein